MPTNLKVTDPLVISGLTSITLGLHAAPTDLTEPASTAVATLTVGQVGLANGTVGAPALSFASDLDVGLYRTGAEQLGVSITGAQVANFKSVGVRVTGNVEHGAVSAFATTEPVSAATFKTGTEPAGAVTTSGSIHTNGTVMRKAIAAGTVSNVET